MRLYTDKLTGLCLRGQRPVACLAREVWRFTDIGVLVRYRLEPVPVHRVGIESWSWGWTDDVPLGSGAQPGRPEGRGEFWNCCRTRISLFELGALFLRGSGGPDCRCAAFGTRLGLSL